MADTRDLEAACLFHATYERLAPSFGYETRKETREFDPESPNGKLMIAVCREVLSHALAEARASEEKAFSMLGANGVPQERARSVANGIDVLATRMQRENTAQREEIDALRELLNEAQRMAVPREPTASMHRAAVEMIRDKNASLKFGGEAIGAEDYWIAMYDAATGGKDG